MSTLPKSCPQSIGISPRDSLHSADPRWKPDNHEEKLLAFLEELILDLARNHPSVASADVKAWLSSVAAGSPKIEKLEERHRWERKAIVAFEIIEKFADSSSQPAKDFLERFKEKFGYEFRP